MSDDGLQLEILQGDGTRRTLALDQSKSVRFGTSPLVEVVVSGKDVHPLHCGVIWKKDQFELAAATAAKLVEVNRTQVASALLKEGDRFRVGDVEVTVVARKATKAPGKTADDAGPFDEIALAPPSEAPARKPAPAPQPQAAGKPTAPRTTSADEMLLAPLDEAPARLAKAVTTPPRKPASKPAAAGSAAKPGKPAAARPQSKRVTKPPAQAKKLPPLPGLPDREKSGKVQGAGKKAAGQTDPKVKPTRFFKSSRTWGILALLAVMGFGAYCAVGFAMRPSADEILAAAEQEYGSGTLGAAAEKFDEFLRRHPSHPQADVARAHGALARLRASADAGGNWPAALSTARETVPSAAEVLGHPDDRRLLADVLAKIAKGLLDEAHVVAAERSEAAQAASDLAREAVALGRRWLPQRLRSATGLDQTELGLARLERERGRARALEAAIRRINAGEADQARHELLDEYAELAADLRLSAALAEAAAAERDHVVFGPFEAPVPPKVDELPPGGVSFASAIGQSSSAHGVVPVLAPGVGCVYGIDAAGGRPLWRRFVGFDTSFVPRALDDSPDADLLLVDSTRSEITRINAQTGATVWRTPLPVFDAEPILAANRVLVACRNGELVALDVVVGAARWKCSLPRPLSVGPAVDPARGLIFQLAEEGHLYVLSESERKCIQVIYLGHEAGEIATPPVFVDRWLLVASDAGLARATLRVLAVDNPPTGVAAVQTLALSGQVASPLLVHERRVYITTVGNGLESFRLGDDPTSPLVPGPLRRADEGSLIVGRLSLAGGKLWLAGNGVTTFALPLDESALAAAAPVAAGQFVQPVVERGESALLVAQIGGDSGVRVQSLAPSAANSVTWTLDVGTAPAAGPVIDRAGTVSILHPSGTLLRTPIDQFKDVAQFVSTPSEGASASEFSRAPLPQVDEGAAVVFDDGLIVFTTSRDPDALLVFNPTEPKARLGRWPLPGNLACRPAKFGNELFLALERGGVYLVDPRSRELVGEPFGGTYKFDDLPQWELATTPDATQAIVSDGKKLYRLVRGAAPALVVEATAELDAPIKSPLAVTPAWAAAADAAGRLVLYDLASLKPKRIALEGAVAWGPLACGDQLLVATEGGQLACLDEAEQIAWHVELPDGLPLSATADGDSLIFTSRSGVVWAVAAATGKSLWRRDIGQPLAGQIAGAKQGILVGTTDGTLYLLPRGDAGVK